MQCLSIFVKYDVFVTKGLGNNSYLVESQGDAFIVDPQRDAWRFLDLAHKKDLNVKYVFETHVHNDYVSGMHQVRDETGAILALPGEGKYEFSHKPMQEGDRIRVGDVIVEALASPGHTYEHMSWLVREKDTLKEIALFSGGSLIVGNSGRTDLLGHHHHPILTEHQFKTLQRYKELPKDLPVLPTHGAGSFCTSSVSSPDRVTSIGRELQTNAAFRCTTLEEFSKVVNSGLRRYPTYYRYMATLNRKGVPVYQSIPLPKRISPNVISQELNGLTVVDLRDRVSFAEKHVKGSLNIELTPSFGSYYGWLLPIDAKTVLVVPDPVKENLVEAMIQLFRIGFENTVQGYLTAPDLDHSDLPTSTYPVGYENELLRLLSGNGTPLLLDVRDPVEFREFSLEGSHNVFFADIPEMNEELKSLMGNGETTPWVLCVSGERSAVAASLLERMQTVPTPLVDGGVPSLLNRLHR